MNRRFQRLACLGFVLGLALRCDTGTPLVFVGGTDAPGLYVMNGDGSGLTRITDDPADTAPSWGPR